MNPHPPVTVRSCTESDLDLLLQSWPLPGDVHQSHWLSQETGSSTYLVAWRSAEPLGSVVIRWPTVGAAGSPELCHLQVRKQFRCQGVGTLLVRDVEQQVLARGINSLTIAVGLDNPDALRLYERLGYQQTNVIVPREYDWTDQDGVTHHEIEHNQILLRRLT